MIWLVSILLIAAIFCAEYFRSRAVFWETESQFWEHTASAMEKKLMSKLVEEPLVRLANPVTNNTENHQANRQEQRRGE